MENFVDGKEVICLGAMSPEKTVQLFADGVLTKEQALQMLTLMAEDDAKFLGLKNWADSDILKGRYEAFISEIENHERAKPEAEGMIDKLKLASPQEVLGAFDGGKIKKEDAYHILNAMKEKEIKGETLSKDGASANLSTHCAHYAVASLHADRKYGELFRRLYEIADRKERAAALTKKMKGEPPTTVQPKTPGPVRRG